MHETLINADEAAYAIESGGTYVLLSPEKYPSQIAKYPKAAANCIKGSYSSDKVPVIEKSRLKKIIEREIFDTSNLFRAVAIER
jgi:hypothetical protein